MSQDPTSIRWWDTSAVEDVRVHEVLIGLLRKLEMRQKLRHRMDRLHATLYADMPVRGLGPFAYTQLDEEPDCARLNLIKACTDTYVAAAMAANPAIQCVTKKGDWHLKRKGEGLNYWIEASRDELGIPNDLSPFIYRNAAVFGTTFAKVYEDVPGGPNGNWKEARVGVDVCFPHEIIVDEAEAQNPRNVRSMYHVKWYDRDVLKDMFPDAKGQIDDAPRADAATDVIGYGSDVVPNMISVAEGYHLRSSRDAKDGYRAIAIQGKTLARVPWELDRFPIVAMRRAKAPMGMWGIGLPQTLRGMQTTINEIMLAYEEAMIFFARPKWAVPRGAGVERAHLDDRIGSIIEYDGPLRPEMYVAQAVMPSDVFQLLQMLWNRGFEQEGINQMLAQGQVPAGLKSGDAIDAYNDTGNKRGIESMKLIEQFHVDLTELMIESGRQIAKHNPKFASTYTNGKYTETVYFRKVDPEQDNFRLKVHPVSMLSQTFAVKLEQLDMMFGRGLIDQRTYRVLLAWTDLDAENALQNAPYEVPMKILADIYDAKKGEAKDVASDPRNAPDPNWPLEYMRARFQFSAAQCFLDNAPEEVIEAVNYYIDLIEAVQQTTAAEVAAAQKAAQVASQGPPPLPQPGILPPPGPGIPPQMQNGAPPPGAGAPPMAA